MSRWLTSDGSGFGIHTSPLPSRWTVMQPPAVAGAIVSAAMSTVTSLDWAKAAVEAPDATYQMAVAYFDTATRTLTLRNRVDTVVGTYTLADGWVHNGDVLTGLTDTGDSIRVQPDGRCTCIGFKKRTKK